jgi:hypothetical protein
MEPHGIIEEIQGIVSSICTLPEKLPTRVSRKEEFYLHIENTGHFEKSWQYELVAMTSFRWTQKQRQVH